MERILNAGRLSPSAANRQILKYIVVQEKENREKLFEHLAWAAYIQPKRNPPEGRRPMGYIAVVVAEPEVNAITASDAGAAMENMILAAWNEGVGSCWICSVNRDKVRPLLEIPEEFHIYGVLALGYPAEQPILETVKDSVQYWLDEENRLHVPKRKLNDIVYHEKFAR
jgi:nitroreductase